jgi:hypothetical protein
MTKPKRYWIRQQLTRHGAVRLEWTIEGRPRCPLDFWVLDPGYDVAAAKLRIRSGEFNPEQVEWSS